jgi:RNA polymerase sigma factor (sigma-70 family)
MSERMNNPEETSSITAQQYPGDRQGQIDFEKFFRENARPLSHFVAIRVSDPHEAEDIAAEATMQMIEYCQRSEVPIENPRALLYRITRHRIIDYYIRKKELHREVPIEDAPQIADQRPIAGDLDVQWQLDAVRAALKNIREEYREAITLHAMVGLTIREMAEMMEKTEVNVRVIIFRARRALKKELGKSKQNSDQVQVYESGSNT